MIGDSRTQVCQQGMPEMEQEGAAVSFFEFWPSWLMYSPVVVQWLWLGLKYRSLGLPLIANPAIPLSGMVGESKRELLDQAGEEGKKSIAPYLCFTRRKDINARIEAEAAISKMDDFGVQLPLVVKPDMGCRGVGVRLIEQAEQLVDYLEGFPVGAQFLLQQKAPFDAEAGVFYIRYPGEQRGKVVSITLKYTPFVTGDGKATLKTLIEQDARAGLLTHIYFPKHHDKLDWIVPKGEAFRLTFAGSHCRGSIFRNGNEYATDALALRLDEIFDEIPGFHYGRLDIKFRDIAALQRGEDLCILEINGASSEATHIWDKSTKLKDAFGTLLSQYRTLFEIGHLQRQQGFKPPSVWQLYRAYRQEKAWVSRYPSTD